MEQNKFICTKTQKYVFKWGGKATIIHEIYISDLVPKGAHAQGYALQLEIKHC